MSKLSTYITETREEMKHVSWPTRKQTFNFTILVIFISIAVAAYLGFFDYLFSTGLQSLF
jgi:preprotein translocase subunit SecE